MRRFAELAQAILVDEMDLHRSYAAEFGISTSASVSVSTSSW
jgi:thiaminase